MKILNASCCSSDPGRHGNCLSNNHGMNPAFRRRPNPRRTVVITDWWPSVPAEAPSMIDVDTFYKIKQLYHDGHLRVRIAEELHLDAETVSKWIQRDKYSQRTVPRRSSKLDAYKTSIIDLVETQALS